MPSPPGRVPHRRSHGASAERTTTCPSAYLQRLDLSHCFCPGYPLERLLFLLNDSKVEEYRKASQAGEPTGKFVAADFVRHEPMWQVESDIVDTVDEAREALSHATAGMSPEEYRLRGAEHRVHSLHLFAECF